MKQFSVFTMITIAVLMLGASAASAQTTTPKPPPTYEQVIVSNWKGTARQDPGDGEGHGVSRGQARIQAASGFAQRVQELRHVTIGLEMTTAHGEGREVSTSRRRRRNTMRAGSRAPRW